MDFVGLLLDAWNTGFWGSIIGWFYDFVGNYGWTIIVFTIALKVCMLPLDFFQRRTAKKNADIQLIAKPEIDKVRAKYANQPEKLNQKVNEKQAEIYKRNNYNITGSCFVMLTNLVLTMVIFFTLFSSLGSIANKQIVNQYESLNSQYVEVMTESTDLDLAIEAKNAAMEDIVVLGRATEIYNELIEAEETEEVAIKAKNDYIDKKAEEAYLNYILSNGNKVEAQKAVLALWDSGEVTENWLWVKNVWKGDTATNCIPTYNEYISMSGTSKEDLTEAQYQDVMGLVISERSGWNGFYLLIILAGGITLLSQLVMTGKLSRKKSANGQAPGGKFLMILLPAIMVIFTLSTNAIFALYVCMNALLAMLVTPLFNAIFRAIDERKKKKAENEVLVDYKINKFNTKDKK